MISALAATTNTTPITASCTSASRRSLHSRNSAISRAAETALICTDQPCGSQPIASAATTPSPATWAIARSIKTMPRSSTSCPSGTCVASTSSPARNAGSRIAICQIDVSLASMRGAAETAHQPVDRVVEQPEQIGGPLVAADRARQHDRRYADPRRDELGGERVLVGGVQNAAHPPCRQL